MRHWHRDHLPLELVREGARLRRPREQPRLCASLSRRFLGR